ncbi:LysR family transcriptional regulator [Sorangium cellulosum]|uniref:LysR family transcriptional regulator n=1 Tax=Sorangium cellulosum TaxID=56 RepID=UPI001F4140E9|nr:LysR family transcriptional regulator [Sorangium cellulosum]
MSELAALDLNLLVVLDALLAERHVTRAAARVGMTQPACSHALGRLRRALGDPLLVRGARGAMLLTPRAEALGPGLRAALQGLATALRGEAQFDPATARRRFRIAAGDYAELVLLPPLLSILAREAPGIDVWMVPLSLTREGVVAQLASGAADVAIGPPRGSWPDGLHMRALFEERFRCVLRRGHPAARGRLSLDRYCGLSHLLVTPRGTPGSFVDDALAALGRSRRVAAAVPHFLVAPHVIAATDLVATLGARIVDATAAPLGLSVLPPPIELASFSFSLIWHRRTQNDQAHRWLRDQVVKAAS